jgi:ubiquinone/menaquinone biosynthesis C-methylase UbiE
LDEFHTGGRAATLALAEHLDLGPQTRVLDAGAGLGGPARTLAAETGAHVTALDLTEEFVDVCRELVVRTGLDDRVEAVVGDVLALPFPDASFDVVWTQHVAMNIADKGRFYRELRRVVRPGGQLAFFDVVAGGRSPIHFPVPWAADQSLSFLAPASEVEAHVRAAGFEPDIWEDATAEAQAWFSGALERVRAAGGPPPLGLHLIVPDLATKAQNMLRNLAEDRVRVLRAVAKAV